MDEMKSLVIMNKLGEVIALESMNNKAHKKSLENGILWMVHGETGRVLPFKEGVSPGYLLKIEEKSFGYTAVVNQGEIDKGSTEVDGAQNKSSNPGETNILTQLAEVIASRHKDMPEGSYTTHLFTSGPDKIRKKLGEEAVELILAREKEEVVYEAADLFYHTLVLLEALDISLEEIFAELEKRHS